MQNTGYYTSRDGKRYDYYNSDGTLNAANVKAVCRIIIGEWRTNPSVAWPQELMMILTSDREAVLERMGVPRQNAAWIALRSRSAQNENYNKASERRRIEIAKKMAENLGEAMKTPGVLPRGAVGDMQMNAAGEKSSEPVRPAEPIEETRKKQIREFVFACSRAADPFSDAFTAQLLARLADPGLLAYAGSGKPGDEEMIGNLPRNLEELGQPERKDLSDFFRRKLLYSMPVLRYMARTCLVSQTEPQRTDKAYSEELNLELKQDFCLQAIRRWLRTTPCDDIVARLLPGISAGNPAVVKFEESVRSSSPYRYSRRFSKDLAGTMERFGAFFTGSDRTDRLSLQKKIYSIMAMRGEVKPPRKTARRKVAKPSGTIRYTPPGTPEVAPEAIQELRKGILDFHAKRDMWALSFTGEPPVYPPALLRNLFSDGMLSRLGIDISFESRLSDAELVKNFRLRNDRGEYPAEDIAAMWHNRIAKGYTDEQLEAAQKNETVFQNLRTLIESTIVPAVDRCAGKGNVLSYVQAEPREREMTREIAARQLA